MGTTKVSLSDIISQAGLFIHESQFSQFISDRKKAKQLEEFCMNNANEKDFQQKAKKYIIQNEKYIDTTQLVLCLYKNYKERIKYENLSREQRKDIQAKLDACKEFLNVLPFGYACDMQVESKNGIGKTSIEIISTLDFSNLPESIKKRDELKKKKQANTARLTKLNEEGKLKYRIQSILLSDFENVICGSYSKLGAYMRYQILQNAIAKKNNFDIQDMTKSLADGTFDQDVEKITTEEYLPEVDKALLQYCEYIDIDKLLLVSGYRFVSAVANSQVAEEHLEDVKYLIKDIIDSIENENTSIRCKIEDKASGDLFRLEYSAKKLQEDYERITETGIFMSDEYIKKAISDLTTGEIELSTIPLDVLGKLDSCIDLNTWSRICNANSNNATFILNNYNSNKEELRSLILLINNLDDDTIELLLRKAIIEEQELMGLYDSGKISLKALAKNSQIIDDIIKMYEEKKVSAEEIIELYKEDLLTNEAMDLLISDIEFSRHVLDSIDKEKIPYDKIKDLNFEFNKTDIIDKYYCDEDAFQTCLPIVLGYSKSIITIEDLSNLYKDGFITENDLLEMATKFYFSNEKIEELYMNSLISDLTLEELKTKKVIDEEFFSKIKKNLTVQQIIENISEDFGFANTDGSLLLVPPGSKAIDYSSHGIREGGSKIGQEIRTVIDPDIRKEKIKSLHALQIERGDIVCDEKNPFYHYEFYVIPNAFGELEPESLVIAERFFKDRNDPQSGLAYGNATYLFKLKDLAVTSKKSKAETIENMRDGKNITMKRVVHSKSWPRALDEQIAEMQGKKLESMYTPKEMEIINCINQNIMVDRIFDVPVNAEDGVLHE